ncbi:hypothetical protein N182_32550 [Sinorhizobium sp. GL2]|nr:hypothetical protein N182_32550 [Sinorhizobium sp. GL2]
MPHGFKTLNLVKQRLAEPAPILFGMIPSIVVA